MPNILFCKNFFVAYRLQYLNSMVSISSSRLSEWAFSHVDFVLIVPAMILGRWPWQLSLVKPSPRNNVTNHIFLSVCRWWVFFFEWGYFIFSFGPSPSCECMSLFPSVIQPSMVDEWSHMLSLCRLVPNKISVVAHYTAIFSLCWQWCLGDEGVWHCCVFPSGLQF